MRRTLVGMMFLGMGSALPAHAEVRLHNLFTEGTVLQQQKPVPVWGTARDGEKVTVQFQNQTVSATAAGGKWMVRLKPLKAGGPYTLKVSGENTLEIKNVLVGEVWICSGQSNMQWSVSASANAEQIIARSADPMLRLFTVPRRGNELPEHDVNATWEESKPETVPGFSAVALAFGQALRKARNVPVGLISTNYGGTAAEQWTSRAVLEADPQLKYLAENYDKSVEAYRTAFTQYQQAMVKHQAAVEKAKQEGATPPKAPAAPQRPFGPIVLYNAMISPLLPCAIRGAIWYQGESNAGRAWEYRHLFPTMIKNWRTDFQQGDFPFLFVQLAPFMQIEAEPKDSAWAELREAQTLTLTASPKTGMAVITDLGDEKDIHPKQKQPVGERLALAARAIAYGEHIVYSGPAYDSMRIDGNRIVLRFKHVGGGLEARDGELKGFAIAGKDGKFVNAKAEIKGNTVLVTEPTVLAPVAVRYGWANYPVVNLTNKEGLPATPFRTDDFPMITRPKQ